MRKIYTLLVVLFCINTLVAQRNQGNTYALIVGISDYNDAKIPDLNYAHIDAIAFADYLKSPAGGEVPREHITLLTQSAATNGAISNALFKLGQKVKKQDRVFFYFSGHGDVENDTIYNLGFLLAWDTPFNCYRNNALSLEDLNREAARMSINKEAEVVYILDACRAGELAGEANKGRSLASHQMKKRKAREVRIMSCESDQLSLESEQIGGGRGIFSYHLIRGLTGLAQKEGSDNLEVRVRDLKNYLEDIVPDHAEAFDHAQDPIIKSGNKKFRLAIVNEEALAILLNENQADELVLAPVGEIKKRGMTASSIKTQVGLHNRNLVNAIKNSELYLHPDFQNHLEFDSKQFYSSIIHQLQQTDFNNKLSPTEIAALNYFQKKGKKQLKDASWIEEMNEHTAIAFNDLAQQAINSYLQADLEEMERRNIVNTGEGLSVYPKLMKKALTLLSDEHPLHQSLKIKYHYFNGVVKRLQMIKLDTDEARAKYLAIAKQEQEKALELDDKAPYVYNEMGILNNLSNEKKKAEALYLKAIELAPSWPIPYSNLCGIYNSNKELDKAKIFGDSAIALNPKHAAAYTNLGKNYLLRNNYIKAEKYYRKAIELAPYNYVPYEQLAYLYLASNEHQLANDFFIEADKKKGVYVEKLDPLTPNPYSATTEDHHTVQAVLSQEFTDHNCDEVPNPQLDSLLNLDPNNLEAYLAYALFQEEQGCPKAAAKYYKKVLELDPVHIQANMGLAQYYYDTFEYKEAADIYRKVTTVDPNHFLAHKNLADILHKHLDNTDEAISFYYKAIVIKRTDDAVNKTLANIFYTRKEHERADIFYNQLRKNSYNSELDDKTRLEMANNFMEWGHESDAETQYYFLFRKPEYSTWFVEEDLYKAPTGILYMDEDTNQKNWIQHSVRDSLLVIYQRQQRYKEAESIFIKTKSTLEQAGFYNARVDQFPDDMNWLYRLTQMEYKHELVDSEKSVERFKKIIAANPNHESLTDMYVNLGQLCFELDSTHQSTAYYELAIAGDTSNANVYLKISKAYLKVYEKEKALLYLEKMYDRKMIDIDNRLVFSELLTLAGRYAEAKQVIDVAEAFYPFEWGVIYKNWANLYMISKEMDKAIMANQKLLALTETNYHAFSAYNLAGIYAEDESYDLAMDFLEKAFKSGFKYRHVLKYDPAIRALSKQRKIAYDALVIEYDMHLN